MGNSQSSCCQGIFKTILYELTSNTCNIYEKIKLDQPVQNMLFQLILIKKLLQLFLKNKIWSVIFYIH